MDNSEACRRRSAECFECAQIALTDSARAAWLNMAQLWLQLAQHIERSGVASIGDDEGPVGDSLSMD